MIKYDYIEEAGQHYWQCLVEIANPKFVNHAFVYDHNSFYNMVHVEEYLDRFPVKHTRKHVFNYAIN